MGTSVPGIPSEERLAELLRPYLGRVEVPEGLYRQLSTYLDLLMRWNARTNLTAIRAPEEMVRRHFGESLFAGVQLGARLGARLAARLGERLEANSGARQGTQPVAEGVTLLDLGSGAGFPGLPIQLLHPRWSVTLAESQGKKASFLREVVRTLRLGTEVWAGRVEAMPEVAERPRQFDVVTLRAVDHMERAMVEAWRRVRPGGWLLVLTTEPRIGAQSVPLPREGPGKGLGWVTMEQQQGSGAE